MPLASIFTTTPEVVISMSTIGELDKLKYSAHSSNVKRRAAEFVKRLRTSESKDFSGVKYSIFIPANLKGKIEELSFDKDDKDDCFVASVLLYIVNHPDNDVCVVTNDYGVQLKCEAVSITCLAPPEELLVKEDDANEKEIKRLTFEVLKLKNLHPKLSLEFEDGESFLKIQIREPLKENESLIQEKMLEIKNSNPFLEPDIKTGIELFSFQLADFYKRTPERVEKYNAALSEFFLKYEYYLRRQFTISYRDRLSFKLEIKLANTGTLPADDIDIYMHFPDGFTLTSQKDYYQKENEPRPPSLSRYSMAPPDFSLPFGTIGTPGFPDLSAFAPFSIKKTNSYEVRDHFKSVKHNHCGKIDPMFVTFDTYEDAKGFEIEYELTAANVPEAIKGSLQIAIEKIAEEDDLID